MWFRRGVNSHNPCGSGWIGIGGEMLMVDVGLNDQVLRRSLSVTGLMLVFESRLGGNATCVGSDLVSVETTCAFEALSNPSDLLAPPTLL